ncbi:MAG: restriction endonuclease subunit S, partial [Balneola sp.]
MEEQNVPQLRFPEFVDSLSNTRLGRISKFSKGKGISKSDVSSNGLDCIRYGELYTTYAELIDETISKTDLNPNQLVISEENDLIIPASGETAVDIATASCVKRSGIALGGDINIVKSEEDSRFLAYYLNGKKRNDIARYAQGSSVIHLYSTQLKLIRLNLPTVKEQQKIASFLSAVDKKIEQLTRKKKLLEEYKKGVMQKLFPQPGEQHPELRFKDVNGEDFPDWEVKRLGEIADRITNKNTENKYSFVLTNSATQGIVSQTDYFDKDIANQNNLDGYYIVEQDDFVYNPRISVHAPVGPIKRNTLETGVMSPLYSVFRFSEDSIDYFES